MPVAFRLGTLNAWALPWFAPHVEERMKSIVARAEQLDLDVMALQEVWTKRAAAALVEAGTAAGYRPLWPAGRFSGGLMTLSRLPAESADFREFAVRGLPQRIHHGDYHGRKGHSLARLETPAGPFSLLVTHLHARYAGPGEHDQYLGIRAAQIAELADCIAEVEGPLVAVGDFNIREGDPEYECLLGLTGLVDAAAVLDVRQATILSANPYVGAGHRGEERIDFVFVNQAAVATEVSRDFDGPPEIAGRAAAYSDHAGMVAALTISAGAAGRRCVEPEAAVLLSRLIERGRSEAERRRIRHRLRAAGVLAGAVLSGRFGAGRLAVGLLGAAIGEAALAERFVVAELGGLEYAQRIVARLEG
jgi:endonuclease/exonuclease/phosphatase family metal-dependent hydrolase